MKKFVKVEMSYISQFTNVLHVQFHRKQYELVAAAPQEKLHLEASLMKAWKDAVELEVKLNKEAQASVHTARMLELDSRRDELLTNLFGVVRAQCTSPVALIKEAARKLDLVFKPYVGIQGEGFEAESGHIAGLQDDAAAHTDEVTALGLTPVLAELKTVNDEYEQLRVARRKESIAATLPSATEVRPQTDEAFELVSQYIQASYLFSTDSNDRQMMVDLVNEMNQISADFKATHKSGESLKKPKDVKQVEKLLPAFEQENGWAPGSLKLTGKTAKGEDGAKLYELKSTSGDTFWVKVEDGKLVKSELKGEKAI